MAEPKREYDDEAALAKIADYMVGDPPLTFEQAAKKVRLEHPELTDHVGYIVH